MLPAGPMAQGFPHLGLIRRALRTLIPRIRDGRLPAVPGRPWTAWSTVYDMLEPELSVQRLARSPRPRVVSATPGHFRPRPLVNPGALLTARGGKVSRRKWRRGVWWLRESRGLRTQRI